MTQNTPEKSGRRFLKGALILTVAGVVVKVIGSLNWIFLSWILGGEGIGIYQIAFPLYLLALSISDAGIPVAVSIITAERAALQDYRGAQRVFHLSFLLLCYLCVRVFFVYYLINAAYPVIGLLYHGSVHFLRLSDRIRNHATTSASCIGLTAPGNFSGCYPLKFPRHRRSWLTYPLPKWI